MVSFKTSKEYTRMGSGCQIDGQMTDRLRLIKKFLIVSIFLQLGLGQFKGLGDRIS